MHDLIKPPMDDLFKKVKFNKQLLHKLIKIRTEYIYKTPDHTEFFSGNLTGVHIVRFTHKDFDNIFKTLLNIDPLKVDKIIRMSENFNQEYKVEGDAFNHVVTYIAHRFLTSPSLKKKDQIEGARESLMFFLLRSIAALISSRFIYPADKAVAKRTYELLSNKFLIKQLGSWFNVLEYRANQAIEEEGLHYQTLVKFDDDFRVKYILTDLSTRMSDLVKNIYSVHMDASKEGIRVKETSMLGLDHEGTIAFKDNVGGPTVYLQNTINTITDSQLYKPGLIPIILDIIPTSTEDNLKGLLKFLGDEYFGDHNEDIKEFVEKSVLYCVSYVETHKLTKKHQNDLGSLLLKLKGAISSSRSTDQDLYDLRDIGEDILTTVDRSLSPQQIASTRTAGILYLYLLAYSVSHFSE